MKRIISFYLLFIGGLLLSPLSAQSDKQARQIVADFIRSVEQQAITADFVLTMIGEDMPLQRLSGTFTMKDNRFVLETGELSIFFDGKTQWTYVAANNEVSVSEPEASEINEINPILILREYQHKSDITFSQEDKTGEGTAIVLTPTVAGSDFNNIVVRLNKQADKPKSIKADGDNGSHILINFYNFEKGLNIPDSAFVFDKSLHEGVYENDLR